MQRIKNNPNISILMFVFIDVQFLYIYASGPGNGPTEITGNSLVYYIYVLQPTLTFVCKLIIYVMKLPSE